MIQSRPLQLRKSNLYQYRLKVKELRNLLQLAEDADQQAFIDRLGEVKDAIGEWHDWEVCLPPQSKGSIMGNRLPFESQFSF
jgi:CHAD domain-containing protein